MSFSIDLMRLENVIRPTPPAFDGSTGTAFMPTASVIGASRIPWAVNRALFAQLCNEIQ